MKLVYVSPLKALSYDIERNLRAPLRGIGADISVGLRTGDTSQAERRAMRKTPPDILITTPESLYLILSSGAREILTGVEAVIVDEIHAVAQSKRGSHLALSLERLEHLVRDHADGAAGPVAAGDPPPPAVAKASSGAVPPTAPPAGEASETAKVEAAAKPAEAPAVEQTATAEEPKAAEETPAAKAETAAEAKADEAPAEAKASEGEGS